MRITHHLLALLILPVLCGSCIITAQPIPEQVLPYTQPDMAKPLPNECTAETTPRCYALGGYRFYPTLGRITQFQMTGGINWEGCTWASVELSDYASTTLLFINGDMVLGTTLQDVDLPSLQRIYPAKGDPRSALSALNRPQTIDSQAVYADRHTVYYYHYGTAVRNTQSGIRQPLPTMQRLSPYLFQDRDGLLYILPYYPEVYGTNNAFPMPIEGLTLDPDTLTHIADQYYADRNGLYWLGKYTLFEGEAYKDPRGTNIMLEPSHGQNITPHVDASYITYGNALFYREPFGIRRMPFGVDDIARRFDNLIQTRDHRFYLGYREIPSLRGETLLQVIGLDMEHSWTELEDALYFRGTEPVADEHVFGGLLVRTAQGYQLIRDVQYGDQRRLEAAPYAAVYIYNQPRGSYEPLEPSEYRLIDSWFYVYKNALYGFDNPTYSDNPQFDYAHLAPITGTNYYTDGHTTFYNMERDLYRYRMNGPYTRIFQPIAPELIFTGIDFDSLQIINASTIRDSQHIYRVADNKSSIQIVPIKALGLHVQFADGRIPFAAPPYVNPVENTIEPDRM